MSFARFPLLILFVGVVIGVMAGFSGKKPPEPAASPGAPEVSAASPVAPNPLVPSIPLSRVLKENITGLSLDSDPKQREQRLATAQKLAKAERIRESERERSSRSALRAARRRFRDAILKVNLAALDAAQYPELMGAVKGLTKSQVQKLQAALLQAQECPSPVALTVAGLSAEQELPVEASVTQVKQLYTRAIECGAAGSGAANMAAFRLGLLYIFKNDLEAADRVLGTITDSADSDDYRQRALFWRAYCAQKLGRQPLEAELRRKLESEYPLSLHTLLSRGGMEKARFDFGPDPLVQLRSGKDPQLNDPIAAAEALIEGQEPDLARRVLAYQIKRLQGAEPELRLYVSALLLRIGDHVSKFQLLTRVLHDDRRFLSQSVMELLYPTREMEMIRSAAAGSEPQSLLLMALIRQESAFNERARSRAGAIGLMQVMPRTARHLEGKRLSTRQLMDPETNLRVGTKYLSKLLSDYSGETELALAAYNAGPERVSEWLRRYPTTDRLLFTDLIPYKETREYVASIARNFFWYRRLYGSSSVAAAPSTGPGQKEKAAFEFRFSLFQPQGESSL